MEVTLAHLGPIWYHSKIWPPILGGVKSLVSRDIEGYSFWGIWDSRQGRVRTASILVRAFWNFKLKVLKYAYNCSLQYTLIPWSLKKCDTSYPTYSLNQFLSLDFFAISYSKPALGSRQTVRPQISIQAKSF